MPRFTRPQKAYAGYIFDCDGTLADTMPLHHIAWKSALKASGASFDFDWALFTKRAGMSLEKTVEALGSEFGVRLDPSAIADHQREVFKSLEHLVKPIQEVVSFADEVRKHARVAVASGSVRRNVERTLRSIAVLDWFQIIITPEDVTHGKPDPEMFLLAAERMGVAPADCLVLEDAELGLEAAARAGMDSALVLAEEPES